MKPENYLSWARFTWWNYKRFASQLARLIDVNSVKRILDVGCGNGLLLDELKIFFPEAMVIGLDSSKEMLTVRDQTNQVVVGRSEFLPFKDNSFDLVTCMYSLHEFRIKKAIKEIHRILKDKGLFSIKEINCEAPKWTLFYLECILNLFFDKKTVESHMRLYQTFKTPTKLNQILSKNGFKILKVKKGLFDFVAICIKN